MDDMQKNKLRKEIKNYRKALDISEKEKMDKEIFNNLLKIGLLDNIKLLLTYISTPIEVGTKLIIEYCKNNNIAVAVPRCGSGRNMQFYYYDERYLKRSSFGIYEPDENKCSIADDLEGAVCITPGLAFDRHGYRLGYGGGYYDTFFEKHKDILSVGICYHTNIIDSLPTGTYDKKVNFIVTDRSTEEYDG